MGLFGAALATAACIPVPVSTVPLHQREERPFALESEPSANDGTFAAPVFDSTGAWIAAYDAGRNQVRIFRSVDLTEVRTLQPVRRPRRLHFSPGGRYLVIEAYQGWIEDFLSGRRAPARADIDSPDAVRDDIQRAEVWNLQSGTTVHDLACNAVATSDPEGGWLWARRWAITPGNRSSALLESQFSVDEAEFSILCWNGVRQRWTTSTWARLDDEPAPPFWAEMMRATSPKWLTGEAAASRSSDGRVTVLRAREQTFGFSTTFLWERGSNQVRRLPGDCATRIQPVQALASDGTRIVTVCNKGLGHALRVWDLGSNKEIHLKGAEFGMTGGVPLVRDAAVALSPDGRYLAVALLSLTEALVITPIMAPLGISRSDLRVWSVDDGRELVAVPIDDMVRVADYFRGVDVAMSPDSATLVVAGRRLRVYRMKDLGAGEQ